MPLLLLKFSFLQLPLLLKVIADGHFPPSFHACTGEEGLDGLDEGLDGPGGDHRVLRLYTLVLGILEGPMH